MGRPASRVRAIVLVAVIAALTFITDSIASPATVSIADCQTLVRERPEELESYECFWSVSREHGLWAEGSLALEALLSLDPANHRARLYLGTIEASRGGGRAEALYREAADGMQGTGDERGEVLARLYLAHFLRFRGRVEEARPELEKARMAAEIFGDQVLLARVRVGFAAQWIVESEYGRALISLKDAEAVVFPEGPTDLQSTILSLEGNAYWALGLYEDAMDVYAREAELLRRSGNLFMEASPRYNIALLAARLQGVGRMEHGEYLRFAKEALDTALSVGHRELELRSRLLMAQELEPGRAVEELRRTLALSRDLGDRSSALLSMRLLAERLWRFGPDSRVEAVRLLDEAIDEARTRGDRDQIARGLCVRATLAGESGLREQWLADARSGIEAIESIRDLQPDGTVRARVFGEWTFFYYRFAGTLLAGMPSSTDPAGDLELAYQTMERMRARVLLDKLDSAEAHPRRRDDEAGRRRDEVLAEIAALQRRLLDRSLGERERMTALARVEDLERQEASLRDAIARDDPDFAIVRAPSIPSLGEIRSLLSPGQALLSFQLSTSELSSRRRTNNGGSWVTVVTLESVSVFPLPEKDTLEEQIAVFLGLFRHRDGSGNRAAERLYADVLREALSGVDAAVKHLVIVPDGRLHRIPFSALRDDRSGMPLAERYEISYAPSVTLWARWKREGYNSSPPQRVLAFANPPLETPGDGEEYRGEGSWLEGIRLSPLIRAVEEAGNLARAISRDGRVLAGDLATERTLKDADLSEYGILHFATHAVVDREKPGRSAVLLAPGDAEEDGLLQFREIVDLDLDGQVVILSACRTASGTLIEGEGLLGLSRAFFLAGARAVVGSLWPVRDDETERLMREFSGQLATGRSLAAALAAARRSRIAAGAPAEAWAGLVVLGDGDLVPLPGGRSRLERHAGAILVVTGVMLLAILLALRHMRAKRARDRGIPAS